MMKPERKGIGNIDWEESGERRARAMSELNSHAATIELPVFSLSCG